MRLQDIFSSKKADTVKKRRRSYSRDVTHVRAIQLIIIATLLQKGSSHKAIRVIVKQLPEFTNIAPMVMYGRLREAEKLLEWMKSNSIEIVRSN